MSRLGFIAAGVLLACCACGGSETAHGGSGVVTPHGIGPLRIDVSTRSAVVAFAGKPEVATTGRTRWGPPWRVSNFRALAYGCTRDFGVGSGLGLDVGPDWSCRTVYYINARTHRLSAFSTDSPAFETTKGISPGMAQNDADRLARTTPHGYWHAIGERAPGGNLVLPILCRRKVSGRCSGKVEVFMLESRHHPIGLTFT